MAPLHVATITVKKHEGLQFGESTMCINQRLKEYRYIKPLPAHTPLLSIVTIIICLQGENLDDLLTRKDLEILNFKICLA